MNNLTNYLSLKDYNFIQLPDSDSVEHHINTRYTPGVFYRDDVDLFFKNAKNQNIKDIYLWMKNIPHNPSQSITFYCFIDKNSIIHKAQLQGGWKTPDEAYNAKKLGFADPLQYREAIKLGFENYTNYEKFQRSGFNDKDEFEHMIELGFENRNELDNAVKLGCSNMSEMEMLEKSGFPHMKLKKEADEVNAENLDVFILVKTIKILPKGLPTPFDTILQKFNEMQSNTLREFVNLRRYPAFRTHVTTTANISEELFADKAIRKLGIYDFELKIFHKGAKHDFREKYEINEDVIIVDGNNVCLYESKTGPSVKKLMAVKNKFKNKDVRIFISKNVRDGNLGKWDDEKTLQKMIDDEDIEVISLQYEDDYWWLNLGFDKNGYIITNDYLEDWQAKNPEKIGELHARKVPFMISKDDVVLGEPLGNLKR